MLYGYEEQPIGFEFLEAVAFQKLVPINFQTSQSSYKKNPYQSYSMQYLGIQLLHSALMCLNIYSLLHVFHFSTIFILASQLAVSLATYFIILNFYDYSRLDTYSTVSFINKLQLYKFKLYQQVLYFDKQIFCGKKTHQVSQICGDLNLNLW